MKTSATATKLPRPEALVARERWHQTNLQLVCAQPEQGVWRETEAGWAIHTLLGWAIVD